MAIDIININERHIKKLVIDGFNKLNNTEAHPDHSVLSFEKCSVSEAILLQNVFSQKGVIMNKVSLNDIFPKTLDLRPFKNSTGVLTESDKSTTVTINNKHNTELVHEGKDVFAGPTNITNEEAKNFLLFCRVFGFYELDVSDIGIYTYEGRMTICVNSNNKVYTGLIEVLV